MPTRVAVFGTGYVGCVSAACLARDGHQVYGVDIDPAKVQALQAGISPVSEPGLPDLLAEQVMAGRLKATLDVQAAINATDLALVAVGTPSLRDGSVDTTAVERVIQAIGESLLGTSRPYTVVLRSTLLPGILEDRLAPLLETSSGRALGDGLQLCNNPEFLRESTAIADYDQPPFIVVGTLDGWQAAPVCELYSHLPAATLVTDTRSAALLKYGCNAFHAVKVAFANELGSLAAALGADGPAVMNMLCQDRRLNISTAYMKPGFAFGGSCLPKDLRAMTRYADRQAMRLNLLKSVLPSNEAHLQRALERIGEYSTRQIGLVGLSFKSGTDDLRESPLVALVETLIGRGYAVRIFDPDVRMSRLRGKNRAYIDQHLPHLASLLVDTPQELYAHAELLLLGNGTADLLHDLEDFSGTIFDLRCDLVRPTANVPVV